MWSKKFLLMVVATLVSIAISSSISARSAFDESQMNDLMVLSDQSNLVFIGRVTQVNYRMSEANSKEDVALPHTIVTYEINQILRGKAPDRNFTMRFVGGPDGRGRFLDVSGVPHFQVGEEDLLFVSSNGEDGCPLALCEWGRYRILEGKIYNAKGVPVVSIEDTRAIARGSPIEQFLGFSYPSPKFDDLLERKEVQEMMKSTGQSANELRRRYEKEAPKQIKVLTKIVNLVQLDAPTKADTADTGIHTKAGAAAGIPEHPMTTTRFATTLLSIVKDAKRAPKPLSSINPIEPFSINTPLESLAPRIPKAREAVSSELQTVEEAAELEALRNRDFNPVIK